MRHVGQPDIVTAEPARVEFRVVELMNRLLDVTPATMDAEIDAVLAAVGTAYSFDRTFIFRFDELTGYSNTHEWVAPGVAPMKPAISAVFERSAAIPGSPSYCTKTWGHRVPTRHSA